MSEKTPQAMPPDNEKDIKEIPGSPDQEHDVEAGGISKAPASLTKGLQGRHMQMIAIGEYKQPTSMH